MVVLRHLCRRCSSLPSVVLGRSRGPGAPLAVTLPERSFFRGPPYFPVPFAREFENRMNQIQHEFDRVVNSSFWRPFVDNQHPSMVEAYRLKNPIIEENGVKKFKLEFDVTRFKPEDVKISTDAKNRTLTIEAKYSDANSKCEYERTITIPEGVVPAEMTCTYKSDGVLVLEAPYTEPAKPDPPKETVINIEHK